MGSVSPTEEYDAIVVGAGFSGCYALHKFRNLGLKVKVFEAGSGPRGVWYWNRYPGARVDSEWPFYQLSVPKVYKDWTFSERYSDHNELRAYFDHIVNTLDLRKDMTFNARVTSSAWSETEGKWTVKTNGGEEGKGERHEAKAKYLFLGSGLLYTKYIPDFPDYHLYKGITHHSSFWPETATKDLAGKKVCVIGGGATSVQIVQEAAKLASKLTILLRRPSICLPLKNRPLTETEQTNFKPFFPTLFRQGRLSPGGFPYTKPDKLTFEASDSEREEFFEEIWRSGSFGFGAAGYPDMVTDERANRAAYDFWAAKTRSRMRDQRKRDIMAPLEPPFPFMTRRSPLEEDYYEMIDRENVELVDLKRNPIKGFTEKGIRFEGENGDGDGDGWEEEFDYVILATGFESYTGSLCNMGLKNKEGKDIKDIWAEEGVATYLGMTVHGFPNCFMSYTPQAPTALSNGTTILECQIDYAVSAIEKMEKEKVKALDPTKGAQDKWCQDIEDISQYTLLPKTDSWWSRSNIPGQKKQMLVYLGGIDEYERQCRDTLEGWKGFEVY